MKYRARMLMLGTLISGCAVTYPVHVVDETDDLLVIRATGQTEYQAKQSAEAKATELLGVYVEEKEPDCNYNPGKGQQNLYGTGVYEDVGSWHECVIYAQKPR